MGKVTEFLDKYRRYLAVMDEWEPRWDGDRVDMLTPGEAFDLLWLRDQLEAAALTSEQQEELKRLDDLLIKYHDIIAANAPPQITAPHSHWWWYLSEGPQVRGQRKTA